MDEDSKTSRSGRVRKRPSKFADFETPDDIDDLDITVNQNGNKTAKNVSLKSKIEISCKWVIIRNLS